MYVCTYWPVYVCMVCTSWLCCLFIGDKGIHCIEDVIHEIYTVGPEFKAVSNFLWPVKLSSPKGGYAGKMLNHHNEGGQCGQQGDKIHLLIKKML